MKKILALFLSAILVLSIAVFTKQNKTTETPANETMQNEVIEGGWNRDVSPMVTDEIKSLLDKALDGITGTSYTPVAYLGNQVVAGRNHAILCRTKPAMPDSAETYVIVHLYEKLDGNVELTDVKSFDVKTNLSEENLLGGWAQPDSPVVTDEAKAALDKSLEKLCGVFYKPVALLSTQIVAGTNYCFLCESTVVYPGAEPTYALVYVFENLDGNSQITEII